MLTPPPVPCRRTRLADRPAMGVDVLKCFPWYSRRRERGKLAKRQRLEGPVSPLESVHPIKPGAGGHNLSYGAYFSEKARVSFRHELDSPTSAINSTI
ncbi:uncharacterized protein C17orf114-like isoform X1 [Mobula birostris]|uniref:uncharacterized protein C17orf114-like isoform X1 n=2 Tax=Mobula birostris TaxID=1983395 RepID=UPI003B27EF3F